MTLSLLKSLMRLHLLSPRGLGRLVCSFLTDGVCLMALLRFATLYYTDDCALLFEGERLTYRELYSKATRLARLLHLSFSLRPHDNVGLICRNTQMSSLLLLALSRLGVNIKLLNTDIPSSRMEARISRGNFSLIIYDEDIADKCLPKSVACKTVSTTELSTHLHSDSPLNASLPHIFRGGNVSVLTGGSSGNYTEASRHSRATQFLPPLVALIKDIRIQDYSRVLISLPFYHGFGLATFITSLLMGKQICLMSRFDVHEALRLIREEKIDILPLVPAMLSRLWQVADCADGMRSVKCIISGGDRLDKSLVCKVHHHLGSVIYNLYGTSEAGFFMLAAPHDLDRFDEATIGRPISGAECELRNLTPEGYGTLWVKSGWAMLGRENDYQSTDDLMTRNSEGFYFFRSRADNMVVCAGENVYPDNVERILRQHPDILHAQVYAVSHPDFGNVLHAQVQLLPSSSLSASSLLQWLSSKLSRPEMPHQILFTNIEMLSSGKMKKLSTSEPYS